MSLTRLRAGWLVDSEARDDGDSSSASRGNLGCRGAAGIEIESKCREEGMKVGKGEDESGRT